jgi:DNA (cytosine-5)-methyltransferase 1
VLDLFSGIGGFSLGLERAGGFETVAFCEVDAKARLVLAKHWPNVPIFEDIRTLTGEQLREQGIMPDVICGGFPCQDISGAGKGAGIIGTRSGLWAEMFRLIRDVRPAWAIVENVSALRSKGLTLVLQNLSEIGYMCEWHCIPVSALGAPHQRDRIWIVAHAMQQHKTQRGECEIAQGQSRGRGAQQSRCSGDAQWERPIRGTGGDTSEDVAHANYSRRNKLRWPLANATQLSALKCSSWWEVEPGMGRVAHGIPHRVDRLRQLGNAVVPQVVELIGKAINAS